MPKLFPLMLIGVFLPLFNIAQQSTAFVPVAETESYRIEEFTWPGEACNNMVNDIVQGPNGFLWFASHCGLFRFDGHEMISYTELRQESLENDTAHVLVNVVKLVWDRFDKLWVCTVGNGLYRFDPETEKFRRYRHNPNESHSLSSDLVWCAVEDKEGGLWVGTNKGLNRFDRKTEHFEHFRSDSLQPGTISNDIIMNIYQDKKGTLWIANGFPWDEAETVGLNRYDPKTNSFISYAHNPEDPSTTWTNAVRGMLEDSRGNFWMTTIAGLQKWTGRRTVLNVCIIIHQNPMHQVQKTPNYLAPILFWRTNMALCGLVHSEEVNLLTS